jgi:hypothetical protein
MSLTIKQPKERSIEVKVFSRNDSDREILEQTVLFIVKIRKKEIVLQK